MISLCPACHAKIHRTRVVVRLMPPLLLELWRELHPDGHEQTALNFRPTRPSAQALALFSVGYSSSRLPITTCKRCHIAMVELKGHIYHGNR